MEMVAVILTWSVPIDRCPGNASNRNGPLILLDSDDSTYSP